MLRLFGSVRAPEPAAGTIPGNCREESAGAPGGCRARDPRESGHLPGRRGSRRAPAAPNPNSEVWGRPAASARGPQARARGCDCLTLEYTKGLPFQLPLVLDSFSYSRIDIINNLYHLFSDLPPPPPQPTAFFVLIQRAKCDSDGAYPAQATAASRCPAAQTSTTKPSTAL